jgi:hypothetical protein
MTKSTRQSRIAAATIATAVIAVLSGEARAVPMTYHGGPVLSTFKIYPLYVGSFWSTAVGATAVANQQAYLAALAQFISGVDSPSGQRPYTRQYGVVSASVANASITPGNPVPMNDSDIRTTITTAQSRGGLPAYGANVLIMVFPGPGFVADRCGQPGADARCDNGVWWGYHNSAGPDATFGVTFNDVGPNLAIVSSHEVIESATDPAGGTGRDAWSGDGINPNFGQEACDGGWAGTGSTFTYHGQPLVQCVDNVLGGKYTVTGFIPVLNNTYQGALCTPQPSFSSVIQFDQYGASNTSTAGAAFSCGLFLPTSTQLAKVTINAYDRNATSNANVSCTLAGVKNGVTSFSVTAHTSGSSSSLKTFDLNVPAIGSTGIPDIYNVLCIVPPTANGVSSSVVGYTAVGQ